MTGKSLTTVVETGLELVPTWNVPDDQNPAIVYIASLGSDSSKRTMTQALNWIAIHLLNVPQQLNAVEGRRRKTEDVTYQSVAWGKVSYQYTQAIRAELSRQFKFSTANKMLAALRGVLKEAFRLGQMSHDQYVIAVDLKPVKGGGGDPAGRDVASKEIKALVRACREDRSPAGARDAAIIGILYACGLRRSEPVALDLADYDPETGKITVLGKGQKTRTVYVNNGAQDALDDWIAVRGTARGPLFAPINKAGKLSIGEHMTTQAIYNILTKRAKEAGLSERFSPHDLRRTFAGQMLDNGVDIATVQKLMGHSSPATTARYDRRKDEPLRKAATTVHFPY